MFIIIGLVVVFGVVAAHNDQAALPLVVIEFDVKVLQRIEVNDKLGFFDGVYVAALAVEQVALLAVGEGFEKVGCQH